MLTKAKKNGRASILNDIACNSDGAVHVGGNTFDGIDTFYPKNRPKACVALDWENIFLSYQESSGNRFRWKEMKCLDKYIHEHYDVINKKAYVDSSRINGSMNMLTSFGYTIVNVPSKFQETKEAQEIHIRNAVDIEMALDIYDEIMDNKGLCAILLVSGDGDFLPIVKRVKKRGKNIFVFGVKGHISKILSKFASQVFYLDNLVLKSLGGEASC